MRIINQIGKQENQFDLLVVFILFFIFSTSHFKLAIVKEIIYLYLNFYVSSMAVYVSLRLFSIMKILQAFSKFASLFTEENQFIFYVFWKTDENYKILVFLISCVTNFSYLFVKFQRMRMIHLIITENRALNSRQ